MNQSYNRACTPQGESKFTKKIEQKQQRQSDKETVFHTNELFSSWQKGYWQQQRIDIRNSLLEVLVIALNELRGEGLRVDQ